MINLDKENLKISLISSEQCNLNCKYCEIAKTVSQSHIKENILLKNSFKNGEYFQNIKQIIEKYQIIPEHIYSIDLWGQEPTLSLNDFCYMLNDLLSFFPKWNTLFFSSNFVNNIDSIFNLIEKIDNLLDNRKFCLSIQISYDGEYGTLINRGIDPFVIKNNIKDLISKINTYNFNSQMEIHLNFHNVVDINILKYIYDTDNYNIKKYWSELNTFFNDVIKDSKKENIYFHSFVAAAMTTYNATKEDGILLAKFNQDSIFLKEQKIVPIRGWGSFTGHVEKYANELLNLYPNKNNINEILDDIIYKLITSQDKKDVLINKDFNSPYCASGIYELKIRYNGQIINCHNVIYSLDKEENNSNSDENEKSIRKELLNSNSCPNLLTSSEKDINKFFYKWSYINGKDSIACLFSNIVNLMELLSSMNQIDYSYSYDKAKLLRHAFLLSTNLGCWDNNLAATGSAFGNTLGKIRWYANGTLDILEDVLNKNFIRKKYNEDK